MAIEEIGLVRYAISGERRPEMLAWNKPPPLKRCDDAMKSECRFKVEPYTRGRCFLFVAQIISDQLIGVPKTSKERACDDWFTEISTWRFAVASMAAIHNRLIRQQKGHDK